MNMAASFAVWQSIRTLARSGEVERHYGAPASLKSRIATRQQTIADSGGFFMQKCYAFGLSRGHTREATLTGFEPVLPP
jgi:hypothetical protein